MSELEARFNETQVVLDTKTLDDEEKSEIIDPINQYLESAEIMTNAEYNDDAYGSHWKFYITTESGEELIIGDSSVKMGDEAESAGAIVFESDESDLIGFFDDEAYDGFKESFDAESYVPES